MGIVAISRQTFSGGEAVARGVASRLGWVCLGREVIFQAAITYGVSVEQLTAAAEQPPSFWQRITGQRNRYLDYFRAALCERTGGRDLVYHGHAGHLLLPGISHVMRVRIIAGMEYRVQAAMERNRMGKREATAYIEKVDRQRVQWMRFLHGVEWNDPSLYDTLINLDRMGVDGAVETIAKMTTLDAFQPTPESIRAFEDLSLSSRVWATLSSSVLTSAADLKVEANDGTVTVSGTTAYSDVVNSIPSVAADVRGVKEVLCRVRSYA